jgi:hypothetical protein
MLNDWKNQLTQTRAASARLAQAHPQLMKAFQGLNATQGAKSERPAITIAI